MTAIHLRRAHAALIIITCCVLLAGCVAKRTPLAKFEPTYSYLREQPADKHNSSGLTTPGPWVADADSDADNITTHSITP